MQRKTILMRHSIIGVLISGIFMLFGCHYRITDKLQAITYHYQNETSVSIKIEKYRGSRYDGFWTIEPQATLTLKTEPMHSSDVIINCDSVRIVFGESKELWFRRREGGQPYTVFNSDNYSLTKIDRNAIEYTYIFSDTQFNMATDI